MSQKPSQRNTITAPMNMRRNMSDFNAAEGVDTSLDPVCGLTVKALQDAGRIVGMAGDGVTVPQASRSGISSLSRFMIMSFNNSLRFLSRRMRS